MDNASKLLDFSKLQSEFTAHIRNPISNPAPAGVEPWRMQIYADLMFNNVENFLSTAFPIARSCFASEAWDDLVKDYLNRHKATSPYFHEIPQEFMEFLAATRAVTPVNAKPNNDPPWLLELCHYEWVEVALAVSDIELPWDQVDSSAELMQSPLVVSPLIWSLGYRWPVHIIGPDNKKDVAEQTTLLIVCRDRNDKVRFIESDPPTSRFLEILDEGASLRRSIDQMHEEMPHLSAAEVDEKMLATLKTLRGADIVLGPRRAVE